jgi:hypothetical protein
VSYWRTLDADEDEFAMAAEGNQVVTVGGLPNAEIRVMDVTNPLMVKEVTGTIRAKERGYAITFRIPETGTRRLLVFAENQLQEVAAMKANKPSAWNSRQKRADVVIVAHGDFLESLQPLKRQQEAEGYEVALVDVEDVYDEFSYGEKTPYALKYFLANARENWMKMPRYLLLVGDASFDPRNYLGLGDFDYVPTKLIDTELMETASDDWYGDSDEDGLPEAAVGRLSVRTADEAAGQVGKIVSYRQQTGQGDWTKKVVLVADINDEEFEFEAASDKLAAEVPGSMSVRKIYRGRLGNAMAREAVLQDLNAGALLMNYIGHGSVALWHGDILTSDDGISLTNGTRLPLVVAMNCLNGYFQDIYTESLAESLMNAPNGGAMGVWASSGLTDVEEQQKTNEELFRQLFGYDQTIGDAIIRAKASTGDLNVRKTWILFGDPTLKLHY